MNEKEKEEFLGDFEYWWSGAHDLVELNTLELKRFYQTWFKVLGKLPERAREKFFDQQPVLICNAMLGRVFQYTIAVPPAAQKGELELLSISGIFIRHDQVKRRDLPHTIAHEIAHIVRRDHKKLVKLSKEHDGEKATDDLSESWGFKRCYPEKGVQK